MGLFGKKKEQVEEIHAIKSEEQILREALESEVEELQKEFRKNQDEIKNITTKMQSVKEEYDSVINNLMLIKKESNLEKMELDSIRREYRDIKSKINDATEKITANKDSSDEQDKTKSNILKMKQELEKLEREHDEIKKNIKIEESTLQEIHTQQIQSKQELEEITSKAYKVKQKVESPTRKDNTTITSVFTSKEKEFIEGEIKKESKGIIEAASVMVGSLKSKLSMAEKELESIQRILEKERSEHVQTKNELEKLKKTKSQSTY
jgi:chromosome segregation ATPase